MSQEQIDKIHEMRRDREEEKKQERKRNAEARSQARRARASEAAARKQEQLRNKRREMSVSVTIERKGRDLALEVFACIVQSLLIIGLWGAFSYERGGTLGLGHAQGVMRLMAFDVKDAKRQIMDFLLVHCTTELIQNLSVCVKSLQQRLLHTDVGMLGYVRKDIGNYGDHQIEYHPTVTDEEKQGGDRQYAMYGNPAKVNQVKLTKINLLERAAVYYKRFIKHPLHCSITHVLTCMLQSGKYSISTEFLQYYGALNLERTQATFNALIMPAATTNSDVLAIFFAKRNADGNFGSTYSRHARKRARSPSPRPIDSGSDSSDSVIAVPRTGGNGVDSDCEDCHRHLGRHAVRRFWARRTQLILLRIPPATLGHRQLR